MARRNDHTREELAEMILTAARDIVRVDGFQALTARAVASRIGYSAGTLYNLFGNLSEIILRMNADTLDRLLAAVRGIPEGVDPERELLAMADAYILFTDEDAPLWNALFEYRLPAGETMPDWYLDRIENLFLIPEAALAPLFGPDEGESRRKSARVLWSGVHGIRSLASTGKLGVVASETVADMTRDLVRTYLAGLTAQRRT